MEKYQSLIAWKRAHKLLIICLQATDKAYHPRALPLFNQIRRAAISVEANIVELNYLSSESAAELESLLGGTMRVLRGLLRMPVKPSPDP